MVVFFSDGFSGVINYVHLFYKHRLRLGFNGYSQLFFYSFLFSYPAFSYAGPAGGNIVGGTGSIEHSGLTTTINQNTSSLVIDWNSYNINSNEVVNYLQPNSSSIALNRILGGSASEIHGQINANGQVVLVNANGIFFGSTASVNVGGLIASGLDISPADFMNGDYIFNEVLGADGTVINSGLINASLGRFGGGNVILLGKRVVNEGVISAKLGSVNLAAGKAAVLTFDNQGLLGIKITKEVLQDELGIDPAVLNSGEITAEGGRILLTASVSQDVFSQAVNTGDIKQATSVVKHEDGSFTLGGGADVINTGLLDVSTTESNQDAGQIVVLGENVSSSGLIKADAVNANGGDIELHANNKTLLTENSLTSATSGTADGGTIKVLGDKVGLFDNATVDVSGYRNGGKVLIGGDYQGNNQQIRNASISYVGENTTIKANSDYSGNGGKVIVWADNTTRFYGNIQARGGDLGGNGGFAEVSGKESLVFDGYADLGSVTGDKGILLLDPKNIRVISTGVDLVSPTLAFATDVSSTTEINATSIETQLASSDVVLQARADISVEETIFVSSSNTSSLSLQAGDDIEITQDITLGSGSLTIEAKVASCGSGSSACTVDSVVTDTSGENVRLNANLTTNGGDINILGDNLVILGTGATRQISTGAGSTGGNIEITGTVVSSDADDPNSLTLTAGTGDVTFSNKVGNDSSDNLGALIINSASNVQLNAVRAGTGGIDITATTINLFNTLRTDDGAGDIVLDGDVVLNNTVDFITGGGGVDISGNLNAKAANSQSAIFNTGTGYINIDGAIGTANQLGGFLISAAGDVTLGTVSAEGGLYADSVNVAGSNSFTTNGFGINTVQSNTNGGAVTINADTSISVGSINTNGGAVSGNSAGKSAGLVKLAAADITVGAITARGSNATGIVANNGGDGGAVSIVATENSGSPSITLNGNIDTRGGGRVNDVSPGTGTGTPGTPGLVTMFLEGTGNPSGSFTTTYKSTYTTGFTVTSNTGGTDTINGADINSNVWKINGENDGILNSKITFKDFDNLTGGSFDDTFTFTSGGSISGLIDGGGAITQDTVNVSSLTDVTVEIGNVVPNSNINIVDIEQITTIVAGNNTLIADSGNAVNKWNIDRTDGGTLNPDINSGIAFDGFKNLTGGSTNDTFTFTSAGSIAGLINGGGGAQDTVNVFSLTDVTVQIGDVVPNGNINVIDVDQIIANVAGNNTLIADNIANDWDIYGANGGTLNSGIVFDGFKNLTGGDFVDDVTVTLSGETGGFNFDGGADSDTVTLTGGGVGYTGVYSESEPLFDASFTYIDNGNSYVVQYINTEAVHDKVTAESLTVNGTVNDDNISLAGNTFTLANGEVSYANKDKLVIAGLAGNDVVDIAAAINIPTTVLEINAESLTNTFSSVITADTLFLNGVDTAGSSGQRIHTNVDYLRLSGVTGDVFITETDTVNAVAVNIAELTTTGKFDLVSAGSVTASADMVSNNDFSITANSGSIILNDNNQLTGELSLLASGGNVTLNNSDTLLAAVDAQTLNIISNSITNTAASQINVTGSTTLAANGQDIVLDGTGHRFTNLTVSNTANLTLFDSESSALTISNVDVTGNADISASGDLNTNTVSAGGTVSLTTDGSVIDGNANSNNVTASLLEVVAVSGIGAGDALETQVSSMDIVNTGSGAVELQQTGVVDLVALKNTGTLGDITFTSDADIRFNPGSVVANRNAGDLFMTTSSGSFLGLGTADINNPDITAQNATFLGFSGTFGTLQRHLVLDVPGAVLIDTQASFNPEFVPPGPASLETRGIDFSVLGAISAVAGEQLVEVETLGEIDPAIFTDLQNYSLQETSIRLPRDQLFEDELEEYDRL